MVAFIAVNFRSAHAGRRCAYSQIKKLQESFDRFLFFLTKQKGSVELILLALQSNYTGSVLINDGTLGAEIKKLKPGAAASIIASFFYEYNCHKHLSRNMTVRYFPQSFVNVTIV